jgi:hypothetical protein
MTDSADAAEQPEQPLRRLDPKLVAEAKLYEVPYQVYAEMTPRERAGKKTSWARKVQEEGKRRGVDPDEFLSLDEEGRNRVRAEHPEAPRGRALAKQRRQNVPAPYVDTELSDGDPDDDTHSSEDVVPATEADPRLRNKPTLGAVVPVDNDDLVGWAQPKNLRDVYARYTIGDGQHFIRVERVEPKVFQQIPCSGHLGEIREPITEDQFRQWYGGRLYLLTVYGPDQKGRKDPNTGLPIIKAKTEPFRYTVPVYPPNVMMLPGMNPTKRGMEASDYSNGESAMNFFPTPHPGMPMTQADANVQKNSLDFLSKIIDKADQRAAGGAGQSADVLRVVSDANKQAIEQANRAAEAREAALRDQIREERDARRKLDDELGEIRKKLAEEPKNSSVKDATELVRVMNPAQATETQLTSMKTQHADEIARLNQSHKDVVEALRDRQGEEIKRNRERLDEAERSYKSQREEIERSYKQRVEDAEKRLREREDEYVRRAADREREHRTQLEEMRKEEKMRADERVQQTEKQYTDRISDLKDRHAAELRMQAEQHSTRAETQKSTFDYQLTSAKERLKRAEEERDEAREEAEKSKNPIEVLEQAKAQAEALGYEKTEENAPKTAGERFAATAGIGISKMFETVGDWGPKIAEALAARGQAPGAPPQRALGAPPQQGPRPRRQNPRTVAWATEQSIPITGQQPIDTRRPPIAERPADPTAAEPVRAEPPPPAPVEAPQSPPPPMPATAVPESQAAQNPALSQNPLMQMFPPEAAGQFRAEIERAITAGLDPQVFASGMMQQVPDGARAMVTHATPEHLIEVVKAMPNSIESPILRRDGKRWVDDLWKHLRSAAKEPSAEAS